MPHQRTRQINELYKKIVAFSPIIGIFGHRQVGKSTLAASLAQSYFTLDDQDTRRQIHENPKFFITKQKKYPTALDECQLEPALFPALKEQVRVFKKPGQFLLTGSVRFTSRKAIRESLAGRMVGVELLPLILSELDQEPLPDTLLTLLKLPAFSQSSLDLLRPWSSVKATQESLEKYLVRGGLPGLCFIREERLRREAMLALHQLMLDRDLRLILETRLSLEAITRFLRLIAANGFNPYNASEMKRRTGLSHQTQKNLLFAMESIFLIRRIPITGRSGEIILMEDQYEELVLSDASHPNQDQLLSAFFRNSRAQFEYRLGSTVRYESYQTRSGARIPIVIVSDGGKLGVIVIENDTPTLSQRRSVDSFLRHHANAKALYLSDNPVKPRMLDQRSMLCPMVSVI
ncbi:MAG: AAA family ATPase [Bdellovibrionota bacterium]